MVHFAGSGDQGEAVRGNGEGEKGGKSKIQNSKGKSADRSSTGEYYLGILIMEQK
jgi:hypothetical protein